jgi:hypothetical protein
MSYVTLSNFKYGLDARRSELTSQPGTLAICENAFVNQGGELEKRKALRSNYVMAGRYTSNLMVDGGLVVFDSVPTPNGWNAWVPGAATQSFDTNYYPPRIYMRLTSPFGGDLTSVVHSCSFGGRPFVIADFLNSSGSRRFCFYDGTVVEDSYVGIVYTDTNVQTGFSIKLANLISVFINQFGPGYYWDTTDTTVGGQITLGFAVPVGTTCANASTSAAGTLVPSVPAAGRLQLVIAGTWVQGDIYAVSLTINGVTYQIGGGAINFSQASFCYTYGKRIYLLAGARVGMSGINLPTKFNDPNVAGAGYIDMSNTIGSNEALVSMSHYQGKLAFASRHYVQIWQPSANPANFQQLQTLENTGVVAKLCMWPLGDLDIFYLADTGVRSLRARDVSSNAYVNDTGAPIDQLIAILYQTCTAAEISAACMCVDPKFNRLFVFIPNTASGNQFYVLSYFPNLKVVAWSTFLPTYQDGAGVQQAIRPVQMFVRNGVVYIVAYNGAKAYGTGAFVFTNLVGAGVGLVVVPIVTGGQLGSGAANGLFGTGGAGVITTAGTGYAVNDFVAITDTNGTGAMLKILAVGGAGNVTQAQIVSYGAYWIFSYDGTTASPITADGYDNCPVTVETPWLDEKTPATRKQSTSIDYEITGSWTIKASMDYRTGTSTLKAIATTQTVSSPDKGNLSYSSQGTHFKLQGTTVSASRALLSAFIWHYNPMGEKR